MVSSRMMSRVNVEVVADSSEFLHQVLNLNTMFTHQ